MLFKKKNDPNAPVQVAVAPNEMVANIWRDALAENGIRCLLKSINLVESMYTAPVTLQYRIMVMPQDAAKAWEALAPFLDNPDPDELPPDSSSGTEN